MHDTFVPMELTTKCFMLVEGVHKKLGLGNLPARVAQKENVLAIASIPSAFAIMKDGNAAFKWRHLCWLLGALVLFLGFTYSLWILLLLVPLAIKERRLAKVQHGTLYALAAELLSLEILASDIGGWGRKFPAEQQEARRILNSSEKTASAWLDSYMPNRDDQNANADMLRRFVAPMDEEVL
jgi:hypothetical protein